MQHVDSHYDIATIGTNYQHHSMHFQSNPEHDSTTNATAGPPSTTSVLRSWRKKDASEKQSNTTSVSEQTNNTTSESQGPVARVAPHNHYPKPPPAPPPPAAATAPVIPPPGGDIYRYQQQYGDFSVQNPPQLPPPVKYSEIIEPMQSIEPIPPIHLHKTKEKTYMEMCSVQQNHMKPYHQEYPNYKQHYDGLKNYNHGFTQAQYHHPPPPHPYLPKESQAFPMQKEPAQYLHNYKIPSNYPRNYPRETGNEFLANLNKIAPDMAQDIINDPHLRDPQYPMYPTSIDQNRIYHQQHHQRIYQRTSPIQHPAQNYPQRNIPQNFNQYQMNQQRIPSHGDHYRMYPPHQRYGQVEQNISPRQYHENIMGFPPRISPNYAPCNQIEYPQHYQPTRQMPVRQDYLAMPPNKPYNIEAHPEIPEIVPEDSLQQPKKTLKAFLENWREEFTEEVEASDSANPDKVQIVKSAGSNRENTLYVLDAMEIPSENIPQYLHLQSIEKLPPNIRAFAYNSNEDNAKQNAIVISANLKSDEAGKPDLTPPKDETNTYQLFQNKDEKPQENMYHQFHEDRPACKLLQSMANARNASLNEKPIEKHEFPLITKEKHPANYEETPKNVCRSLPELITEDGGDINRNQDNLENEYSKIVDSILEENANNKILTEKVEEPKIPQEEEPESDIVKERKSVIVAETTTSKPEHKPQDPPPDRENLPAIQDLTNLEDPIDLSHHFEHLEEVKDESKKEETAEKVETNEDEDDFNIEETKHVYTDILSFKEVLNLPSQENSNEKVVENEEDKDSISSKITDQNDEERSESKNEGRKEEDREENDERIIELSIPDDEDQTSDAEEDLVPLEEPESESKPPEPDLIEEEETDKIVQEETEETNSIIEEEVEEIEEPTRSESPKKIEEPSNSLKQEDELGSSFVLEIAKELLQINVSEDINGEKVISVTPLTKVKVVTSRRDVVEPVEGTQSISGEINEETSKIMEETSKIVEETPKIVEETSKIEAETPTELREPVKDDQTEIIEETQIESAEPIEEMQTELVESIEETQTEIIEEPLTEIVEEPQTEIVEEPQTEIIASIEETRMELAEPIEEIQTEFVEPIEQNQTEIIEEPQTEIIEPIEVIQTEIIVEPQTEIIEPIVGTPTDIVEEPQTEIIVSIEETQTEITEPIEGTQTEVIEPIDETKEIPKEETIEDRAGKTEGLEDIITEITITSTENVIEEIPEDVHVRNDLIQEVITEDEHVITETDLYLDNEVIIGDKVETNEIEIPLDNLGTEAILLEEEIKVSPKDAIINNNYIENLSCVETIKNEPQKIGGEIKLIPEKDQKPKTKNSLVSKLDKHKKYLKNGAKKKRRVKFDLSALKKSDPLANLAEKNKIFSSVVVIDKLPIDSVAKFATNTKNNTKIIKTPISNIEFKKLKNKYKKKLELAKDKRNHLNQLNPKKNQKPEIKRQNPKDPRSPTKEKTQTSQIPENDPNQNTISPPDPTQTSPNKKMLPTKGILKKPDEIPKINVEPPNKQIIPEKKIQTPKSILKKTWDYQAPTIPINETIKPINPDQINPETKQFPIPKSILKKSQTQFVDYQNYNCAISKFKELKRNKFDKQFQLNYLENYKKRRLSLEEYNNRKKKSHSNVENLMKPQHTPKHPISTAKDDKEEAMVEEVLRSLNNDVMGFEEALIKIEEEPVVPEEVQKKSEDDQIIEKTDQPPEQAQITTTTPRPNDDQNPTTTPTTSEEPQSSNNDVLKTPQIIDKSTIEEKLNSLEEFLPKIAPKETPTPRNCDYNNISKKLEEVLLENPIFSSQKFNETALVRRFLNDEILSPEELKKISQIVQYKKAMQTLKKQNCLVEASPRRRHSSEFAKSIKIDFSDFDIRRNPNEPQNQTRNLEEKSGGGRVCYNRSISAFIEEESKRNSSVKSRNRPDCLDWSSSDRRVMEETSSKTPENLSRIQPNSPTQIEDNQASNKSPEINQIEVRSSESFAVTNKHSILNIMAGSSNVANQSNLIKHAIENIIKIEQIPEESKEIESKTDEMAPDLKEESVEKGEDPLGVGSPECPKLEPQIEINPGDVTMKLGIQRNDPETTQNLKKNFDKSKMIKSIMVSARTNSDFSGDDQNLPAVMCGDDREKPPPIDEIKSKPNSNQNETKHSKSTSKTKAELKSFQDIPENNNSNTTKTPTETKEQQQPVSPVISNITKLTALLTYYKKGIESGVDNANLKKIEEIIHRLSPNLKNLPNLPEVTAPNEYEVAKDDNEATKLKLHLKKKQQNDNKKRKKRFRNLYTENESDEDPNCPKTKEAKVEEKFEDLTDYSVYQRKNLAGVPKLVLKRRKSDVKNCLMQPYVKISRVETIESMVKRRKKSILVNQIDD